MDIPVTYIGFSSQQSTAEKKVKAINAACLLRHKSRKTIETWYFTCCAFRRCYIRVFRTFRMHTYAVRRQSFFHSLIILTLSRLISMCAFFGSFSLHFYEILASDNCERFCFFQKKKKNRWRQHSTTDKSLSFCCCWFAFFCVPLNVILFWSLASPIYRKKRSFDHVIDCVSPKRCMSHRVRNISRK